VGELERPQGEKLNTLHMTSVENVSISTYSKFRVHKFVKPNFTIVQAKPENGLVSLNKRHKCHNWIAVKFEKLRGSFKLNERHSCADEHLSFNFGKT
jgi:hypothetical protein